MIKLLVSGEIFRDFTKSVSKEFQARLKLFYSRAFSTLRPVILVFFSTLNWQLCVSYNCDNHSKTLKQACLENYNSNKHQNSFSISHFFPHHEHNCLRWYVELPDINMFRDNWNFRETAKKCMTGWRSLLRSMMKLSRMHESGALFPEQAATL